MFTLVCSHFYSRLETLVRTDNKLVIEINLLSQWSKFIWMMEELRDVTFVSQTVNEGKSDL